MSRKKVCFSCKSTIKKDPNENMAYENCRFCSDKKYFYCKECMWKLFDSGLYFGCSCLSNKTV